VFLLCTVTFASTNIFASTCPTSNPDWYNGTCIEGLIPGSYPYFETSVDVTWDKKKDSLTASEDNNPNTGGVFLFYVSESDSYAITQTKFDFSASIHSPYDGTGATGHIEISGNMDLGGNTITGNPVLMSADLKGLYGQDGTLIGFNTKNIVCNTVIDTFVGGCTTDEVVYFNLIEAIDFNASTSTKKAKGKTKTTGTALTSVPLPAAVWLFGSGLLGLMGIARRRKIA
jgi:hypothetical protein